MTRDIVLLTIDCWRYDAIDRMSTLQELTSEYTRSETICQASSTRGAFPALLNGLYYPQAFTGFDTIKSDTRPLPELLSENGYATCGICGSNPFLSPWRGYFDHFWNDRMERADSGSPLREKLRAKRSTLEKLFSYLRLRSRVPATDVASRARAWYEGRDGPRFLWMHLMDVHMPYLPGLRRGLQEGLLGGYLSHLRLLRDPESLSDGDIRTLERFYWRSVDRLDEQMDRVLRFVDDDALVVVVGDHGEEFDHGEYGHVRLYEECVRVPLLVSPALADRMGDVPPQVRQIDLPATLVDAIGQPVPDEWEGEPATNGGRWPAFVLNHSQLFEQVYAGIRTERFKLMKTFPEEMDRTVRTEAYDLRADADERHDVYGQIDDVNELERQLDAFLDRDDIRDGILERPTGQAPSVVEDRLKALGYK